MSISDYLDIALIQLFDVCAQCLWPSIPPISPFIFLLFSPNLGHVKAQILFVFNWRWLGGGGWKTLFDRLNLHGFMSIATHLFYQYLGHKTSYIFHIDLDFQQSLLPIQFSLIVRLFFRMYERESVLGWGFRMGWFHFYPHSHTVTLTYTWT